jgi:hypothetical protein
LAAALSGMRKLRIFSESIGRVILDRNDKFSGKTGRNFKIVGFLYF